MRTFWLILALVAGALLPQAHVASFLVRYLIMMMLFLAFLKVDMKSFKMNLNIILVLLANIIMGFAVYFIFRPLNTTLAIAAFITAITPTATAAPVITSFLKGKVEYVVSSLILTNSIIALGIPFVLPLLTKTATTISTASILLSTVFVVFLPLALAQALVYISPPAAKIIARYHNLSFFLWLLVLFIATANSVDSIIELKVPVNTLISIAAISFVICIINFSIGSIIGGEKYSQEASQSLGQKNTILTIWIASTFISPIAALGPMFYVIYHNLYNSYQLYRFGKRQNKDSATTHAT